MSVHELLSLITIVSGLLLFPLAFAYLWSIRRLYVKLQTSHPNVFEELGSPSLLWNNSLSGNFRLIGFLFAEELDIPEKRLAKRLLVTGLSLFFVATTGTHLVLFR